MTDIISDTAVRVILSLLFLLASFTRPGLFWTGLLALVFLLIMPISLALYLTGLIALEFLSVWAANPACDPAERHVLLTFYWSALPGMLAHGVAGVVAARHGRPVPLYWAGLVAVGCRGLYAWRIGEVGGDEWEYLHGAPWLWADRLLRMTCMWRS